MARKFLYINGLAILAVILFHASGWGFTAMLPWAHQYLPENIDPHSSLGSFSYYALRAVEQWVMFSIPIFLFVSGYFAAFNTRAQEKTIAWKTVLNRIKFLAIPYLFWTIVLLAVNLLEGKIPTFLELIEIFLTGSISPAYYFVILLIQFYLLAPFLIPLARNHWKGLLLVTGIIQILIHLLQYVFILQPESSLSMVMIEVLPKWFFLVRLFWFSLGLTIGFHRTEFKKIFEGKTAVWISATVILYILGFIEWEVLTKLSGLQWIETRETIIDALYALTLLFTLLSLNRTMPIQNLFEKIGAQSFGIYLVHIPVMLFLAKAIYHFWPWLLSQTILFVIIIAAAGLGLPLLVMWIFRRSSLNRVYGYIFG
jgi:surface polysaccharide O-acyltransferase-like enzyme